MCMVLVCIADDLKRNTESLFRENPGVIGTNDAGADKANAKSPVQSPIALLRLTT